jgi:hypothetical protein
MKRTLNFQRPTSNLERQRGAFYLAFCFRVVRMLETNMRISSSVSPNNLASNGSDFSKGTRWISRNQRKDSRNSFKQMLNLWTKSLADSAACASP